MKISAQELSYNLYVLDPANTCCFENECEDEYDSVARQIIEDIKSGTDAKVAVGDAFRFAFSVELPYDLVVHIANMIV